MRVRHRKKNLQIMYLKQDCHLFLSLSETSFRDIVVFSCSPETWTLFGAEFNPSSC